MNGILYLEKDLWEKWTRRFSRVIQEPYYLTADIIRRKQTMTNDSRRFGFTYGYDDAVTAAMQERTYQWMDIVFVDFGEISGDCLLRKSRLAIVLSGTEYNESSPILTVAPMITVFSDRIEILSRGTIPPGQTMEGFYAGESVPVNQKLSDMLLQLH